MTQEGFEVKDWKKMLVRWNDADRFNTKTVLTIFNAIRILYRFYVHF